MKDVAARAGVSVGTVSNVLNRPQVVRPATRLRVEAAMADLGFVRNESARQLRVGHSRVVGYVLRDVGNPYFTDVARGAEEACREAGLALVMCDSGADPEREADHLALLLEQRVKGVLVATVDESSERLASLPRLGVPVVLVDRGPGEPGDWCSLGVDDVHGGRLAVGHLLATGHDRIAFVGGSPRQHQMAGRLAGAREALVAAGRDVRDLTVVEVPRQTAAGGREAAARLLALPAADRPTGVFCANDLAALGLLAELLRHDVRVPDDVAIVGYDDIEFAASAIVPLTSVRQPRVDLGRRAVDLLLRETARDPDHRHDHVRFTPELVVRASTRH